MRQEQLVYPTDYRSLLLAEFVICSIGRMSELLRRACLSNVAPDIIVTASTFPEHLSPQFPKRHFATIQIDPCQSFLPL